MASGDTLLIWTPQCNEPPVADYATPDVRDGSTTAHPVLDFDDTADESAVFSGVMPRHYDGGGVTVTLHWAATSATTGAVVWAVAFERIGDEQQDIDSEGFAAAQSGTFAPPGTSGLVSADGIAFTDGAQIDNVAAGEGFRLDVYRDADHGSDNMPGDAELRFVEMKET